MRIKNMKGNRSRVQPVKLELDRVSKFSIIDLVRNEVQEIIDRMPQKPTESFNREMDNIIKKNLLEERKVRFGVSTENNGPKAYALGEIEIILSVLDIDKNNRLIIKNFDFLKERLKSVEQRLTGLMRKKGRYPKPEIKIDPERIKSNVQNFVDLFNKVFSSTYEILTNNNKDNSPLLDETLSSKNRLKFHLLSNLSETKRSSDYDLSNPESNGKQNGKNSKNMQTAKDKKTKNRKCNSSLQGSLKEDNSQTDLPQIKAQDSLITLRQRFKALPKKDNKDADDLGNTTVKYIQIINTEPPKKKKNNSNEKKPKKKNSTISYLNSSNDIEDETLTEDTIDIECFDNVLTRGPIAHAKESSYNRTNVKNLENSKNSAVNLYSRDQKEFSKATLNKVPVKKSNVLLNGKEKLTKVPPKIISTVKIVKPNDLRKNKIPKESTKISNSSKNESKIGPNKEKSIQVELENGIGDRSETNYSKKSTGPNKEKSLPRLNMSTESKTIQEDLENGIGDRSETNYLRKSTGPKKEKSVPRLNMSVQSKAMPEELENGIGDRYDTNLFRKGTENKSILDFSQKPTQPCIPIFINNARSDYEQRCSQQYLHNLASNTDFENSEVYDSPLPNFGVQETEKIFKETEILDDFIADIKEKLSMNNKASVSIVSLIKETKEGVLISRIASAIKEKCAANANMNANALTDVKDITKPSNHATIQKTRQSSSFLHPTTTTTTTTKTPTATVHAKNAKIANKNGIKDYTLKSRDTCMQKSMKTEYNEQQQISCLEKGNANQRRRRKGNFLEKNYSKGGLRRADSDISRLTIEPFLRASGTEICSTTSMSYPTDLKLRERKKSPKTETIFQSRSVTP